ncbi:MAG: division/cell wall cluster transcriptional repressor MraZ [Acidobacteria bacterium]|nr:division/cell wall cluster transcriptional repressor MraZ [Acidobacteriota bacterium]
MFRGNHPAKVDEKGRLKLPSEFKRRTDEVYGPRFYVTSTDGKRARVYPMREWEKIEAALMEIPSMNAAKKKFLDVTNYYGQEAEIDAQGRILVPQILREAAKLTTDCVVLGVQTYLEIANREEFEAELKAAPLNAEDEAALAALGI